jgi:hypothetical protein
MKLLPTLFLLAVGCVVPYGEAPTTSVVDRPQATSAMGDLTGLEARVLLLMDENEDADRAARLEALRSLLRRSRTWSPDAQRDLVVYLEALLRVEERWRGDDALTDLAPIVPVIPAADTAELIHDEGSSVALPVVEERLDEEDAAELPPVEEPVTETPARSPEAIRDEGVVAVREALSRSDYRRALDLLEQLDEELGAAGGVTDEDERLDALRLEAVDGWVHAERERAGKLFLSARQIPEPEARRAAFVEVADILRGLRNGYPESSYADAIARNLALVERELGTQ